MAALLDFMTPGAIEAGCDEAGRGCLAGPVFAAAVIIPEGVTIDGLNDSKQLTEKIRRQLREEIESKCHWCVASLSPADIDKINILNASIQSMHLALEQLKVGVMIGSLRKESYNRKVFVNSHDLVPETMTLTEIPIWELPLFNQEIQEHPTPVIERFWGSVREADAILFMGGYSLGILGLGLYSIF